MRNIKRIHRSNREASNAAKPELETLYTPEEVAKALQVSTTKVYRLIRSGRLEAVNLGRLYRITPSAIEKLVNGEQPKMASKQ